MQQCSLCFNLGQEDLAFTDSEPCSAVAGEGRCVTSIRLSVPVCFHCLLKSVFRRRTGIYHEFVQC